MKEMSNFKNFYEYWENLSSRYENLPAFKDDYLEENYTFNEAFSAIKEFSSGLKALGLKRGEHISIFSENSVHWIIADQAILISGMVDALRGSSASVSELEYILEQSDSSALIVENTSLLKDLMKKSKELNLKCIIYLSKEEFNAETPIPVYSFDDVMALGKNQEFKKELVNKEDLATLIYTSGTTGAPKGVMLTQGNLLSQVKNLHAHIKLNPGKEALCILPIWHAYERSVEYYLLFCGISMVYTNLKNFKPDIKKYQPGYFVSVPRIWEAIYDGIQKSISVLPEKKQNFIKFCISESIKYKNAKRILKNCNKSDFEPDFVQKTKAAITAAKTYPVHSLATKLIYNKIKTGISENFTMGISGGGALQAHIEEFFDTINMTVLNGYGLTESSPVISFRSPENKVLGSVGMPIPETKIKVIDPETKLELKNAKRGVLCVRGPQVMRGYYKNPEATKGVISRDGWLNTGDLVEIAPNGSIIITGRAKDTIVLSNGENIEPQGIEDACLKSLFIKQIVLVGQDKPSLGALIVPNYENIKAHNINDSSVLHLIQREIKELVQSRNNFRPFERISSVRIVNEEFSMENGLMTPTVKIKRNKVFEKYSELIEEMFV